MQVNESEAVKYLCPFKMSNPAMTGIMLCEGSTCMGWIWTIPSGTESGSIGACGAFEKPTIT